MIPGNRHASAAAPPADELCRCVLHGLRDSAVLADLLGESLPALRHIARANEYRHFESITGGKLRQVAAPVEALASVQRGIRGHLAQLVPPDYLHSGVRGRSHVTNAAAHLNGSWLFTIDLKGFYEQMTTGRVRRFFTERMQCAPEVSLLLTQLCTHEGHLPIGARISQPLAFLILKPLFDELARLAREGDLVFSVYVDDLCFSGDRATPSFLWQVKQVIHGRGLRYHAARSYRPGAPRLVTGVLLTNGRMTICRKAERQIAHEVSTVLDKPPDREALLSLQGRLAAAASIDARYRGPLRALHRLISTLRDPATA